MSTGRGHEGPDEGVSDVTGLILMLVGGVVMFLIAALVCHIKHGNP